MSGIGRRALLVLAAGTVIGLTATDRARAAPVRVGDLEFTPPTGVEKGFSAVVADLNWQWQGFRGSSIAPSAVVLARSDLQSTSPDELLASIVIDSATGSQPGLHVTERSDRESTDGRRTRFDLRYRLTPDSDSEIIYTGSLLVLTRPRPPAAMFVVLSSGNITGTALSGVLDSARWIS